MKIFNHEGREETRRNNKKNLLLRVLLNPFDGWVFMEFDRLFNKVF